MALTGAGLSLSTPLIALRLEAAGYTGGTNGLGMAVSGLATLLFAPFVPTLAARIGMRPFILACLLWGIAALAALAATDVAWWWPLRFAYGFALTGMFVASEFAINALAPPHHRGVWIGIYSTMLAVGFAVGPLLLRAAGTSGAAPFVAGIALFIVAGAPVVFAGKALPTLAHERHPSAFAFMRRAPSLMSAAFVYGAIETGGMGLLPVHAVRNGFSTETGAVFVAALALGNLLFQLPVGILSDRVPRGVMLLGTAGLSTIGALLLATLSQSAAFLPLLLLWSGVASGLYMIGLAELGARYKGGDLAAANAAFVTSFALGMVTAPPLIGLALDRAPASGLFLSLAALCLLTFAIQFVRWRR